ncbi:hypothetical protein TVAG_472650 [Trichomonas vaginalis G3]|uniref:DUF3447 domain-containing protein n=1 Tax=Trichomonas vaginalis (strain ATCC PRA-98 / G3) TaxID=412133 RepID=A2FU92_TRIV3|nr:protein ubiquitination [Trichomonas vaginalis G3]EAX91523.1 hypothetical protein TVAG_472650 [Trichomonas vaginalis G3]KAI5537949.1 protein ubiquitination [Trichomonas vaginalis G3]|eukprot:XP_001304453.1 hypothetical protein [Trichomonas vaginalis G3]
MNFDYNELVELNKDYIRISNNLYRLNYRNEEEINQFYSEIKKYLIDTKIQTPSKVIEMILTTIRFNLLYFKSYQILIKKIIEEFHPKTVNSIYKKFGIDFQEENKTNYDTTKLPSNIHEENSFYRAIMDDNKELFIIFIEQEGFDKDQKVYGFYPYYGISLLEMCCYYGSVGCFKLLRTKFNSDITRICLHLSFLGGNPDIMSECLKYEKPDYQCMKYAIISHNIDFITFLINEHNLEITNLQWTLDYHNLQALFVDLDRTKYINTCFAYASCFNIPSLCEYFLAHGLDVNVEDYHRRRTALHYAAWFGCKEAAEFLILHGAWLNSKDTDQKTALHYAAENNMDEIVELLISYGADVNAQDYNRRTPLSWAAMNNNKEAAKVLTSHGGCIYGHVTDFQRY